MEVVEAIDAAYGVSHSMGAEFVGEELRRHRLEFNFLLDRAIAAVTPAKRAVGFEFDGFFAFRANIRSIGEAENVFGLNLVVGAFQRERECHWLDVLCKRKGRHGAKHEERERFRACSRD